MVRGTREQILSQRNHNSLFYTKIRDTNENVSINVYFLTLISSKDLRQFITRYVYQGWCLVKYHKKDKCGHVKHIDDLPKVIDFN